MIPEELRELTIDIETRPPELSEDRLRAVAALKLPKRITKASSITAWIDAFVARGDQFQRLALDVLWADIVSIAVKEVDGPTVCWVDTTEDDMRPIDYFAATLRDLIQRTPFLLVGHNIIGYDAPILWRHLKAAGYSSMASYVRPNGRYKSHQYYDTMLQYPGESFVGLKAIALANDWPIVDGFSGGDVYQAWQDERFDEIGKYNCHDVELTWRLYQYLTG